MLVEAETDVEYDLDHVALYRDRPAGDGGGVRALRVRARRATRASRWAARSSSSTRASPGAPERPLLNHLAVLVDSAEDVIADAGRTRHRGRVGRRRGEHLRRVPLGPRARAHRVRRAQAHVLADVIAVAGAGMSGLVAAARLRELGVDCRLTREGLARRRVDAALVVRRLAPSRLGRLPPRVPGRRRAAAAPRLGAARRRDRLARVARRAGGLAGDRQPAHGRQALRPARPDRDARSPRGRVELERYSAIDRRRRRRSSAPAASPPRRAARRALRRPGGAAAAAGEPMVAGRRPRCTRRRAARRSRAGWTSSTGATCRTRAWGETSSSPAPQLYGRFARVFDEDGVEFFERDEVTWSETNLVQATAHRPGARAYYVLDEPRRSRSACASGRSQEMVDAAPRGGARRARRAPFAAPPGLGRGGAGRRLDHAHGRRAPRRRPRARAGERTAARSTGSGRRASTPAASRPAAMRAVSRRRSCSGLAAADDAAAAARARSAQVLPTEKAQRRVVARQGRRADLRDDERLAVLVELLADRRGARRRARAARSRSATRRRAGTRRDALTARQSNAGSRTAGSVTVTVVRSGLDRQHRSCRAAA